MTATAIDSPLSKAVQFYDAPIGKKVVMAITGAILFGFVMVHMAGNLQFFLDAKCSTITERPSRPLQRCYGASVPCCSPP